MEEERLEKEILLEFSKGSVSAFEKIYNRFHTRMYIEAHRHIKSEDDAKDIRSKCFIKLWELREQLHFESMGALFCWLRANIIHSCIDLSRSISIREVKQTEVIFKYWQDNHPDIFEASDKEAIILERLLKQIEELPPKFKVVFKMRWLDDLKFREIAEKLNADLSTIKKRYARALILLRKQNLINI